MKTYSVVFTKDAELDLEQIKIWYNAVRPNLGLDFYEEVLKVSGGYLTLFPKLSKKVHKNRRLVSLRHFPYSLIYTMNEVKYQIFVLAVVHHKRHPKIWKR